MHASENSIQQVYALSGGELQRLELPAAETLLPEWGIAWGEAEVPLTPAYWAAQSWMWKLDAPDHFRLGNSLEEELLACMLGGYGIPAEVGLAAYEELRQLLAKAPAALTDPARVLAALSAPLQLDGRFVRYRFARQKAKYVAEAFKELPSIDQNLNDKSLRDRLTKLRGVGPKTASWVVRNLRQSDSVAILDIHILRAGRSLGIFDPALTVERHYALLESAYLQFSHAIATPSSILDSVMWITMRQLPAALPIKAAKRDPRPRQQLQLAL